MCGVPFPKLPEHRQLSALKNSLKVDYGMHVSAEGTSVELDISICIARDIEYASGIGLLEMNTQSQVLT